MPKPFYQEEFAESSSCVAAIDSTATIVWVNRAWEARAATRDGSLPCGVGCDYLALTQESHCAPWDNGVMLYVAATLNQGLQQVLSGEVTRFQRHYRQSGEHGKEFLVTIERLVTETFDGALMLHSCMEVPDPVLPGRPDGWPPGGFQYEFSVHDATNPGRRITDPPCRADPVMRSNAFVETLDAQGRCTLATACFVAHGAGSGVPCSFWPGRMKA